MDSTIERDTAEPSEVEVRPAAVADASLNALWTERFRPIKAAEVRTLDLVSANVNTCPAFLKVRCKQRRSFQRHVCQIDMHDSLM